jgi:GNAT superfamily N-acetyltransferase
MTRFTTRPGTDADLDRVAEIRTLGWQSGYRGILSNELLDGLDATVEADRWRGFARLFDEKGEHLEVAEHDGVIVGYVLTGPFRDDGVEPGTGEVMALYLDPESWGSGAADALLTRAHELLADRGHRRAGLWVFEDNARARRFYERHGWTFDGTRETEWYGSPETGVEATHIRYVIDLT